MCCCIYSFIFDLSCYCYLMSSLWIRNPRSYSHRCRLFIYYQYSIAKLHNREFIDAPGIKFSLERCDQSTSVFFLCRAFVIYFYLFYNNQGTLSTTGHSTNFVTWIEIPSNQETIFRSSLVSETNAQVKYCDQSYWIKAGVACFCALRY